MPDYNIIDRTGAASLIPVQTSRQIIQSAITNSTFLRLANRMPDMTAKQMKIPVMTGNISASFIAGDTALKPTSAAAWDGVTITAEELAVIVPIPEAVLDDAEYDIWGEIYPRVGEAFGKAIDAAAFFSTNKPSSWPEGLVNGAISASQSVVHVDGASGVGLYQEINGEGGVIAMLEENGIDPTGYVGALSLRSMLRGAVDQNGQPIMRSAYTSGAAGSMVYELNGAGIEFPNNGAWDSSTALLLAGDFRMAKYAIRQDITYKILTESIISDSDGKVLLNLAQQDCVALRAVMRLGWALPKPVNPIAGTTYYPFAVLEPAGE